MKDSNDAIAAWWKLFALPSLVIFKYRFPYISLTRRQLIIMFFVWLPVLYAFYIYIYMRNNDYNPNVWPLPSTIFLLVCVGIGFYHQRDARNRWKEENFTTEDYPPKSRLVQYFGQFVDEEFANRRYDPLLTALIGLLIFLLFGSFIGAIFIISAGAQIVYFRHSLYADEDKRRYADWVQRVHREHGERKRAEVLGTPTIYERTRKRRPVKIEGESRTSPSPQVEPGPVETLPATTEKSAWQKELERRARIMEEEAKNSDK